ncbi:MAG: TonB-dependent receptor [Gammaproteobacteria bacterium]|nr:TonB-dependent receptor [Gammaproteobacteria bacterium]
MDDRIRLNASAFHYKVEDFQAQVFLTVATGSVITNAGDVEGTGAEFELNARISDKLRGHRRARPARHRVRVRPDLHRRRRQLHPGRQRAALGAGPHLRTSSPAITSTWATAARSRCRAIMRGRMTITCRSRMIRIPLRRRRYGLANAKVAWSSLEGTYTVEAFVRNLTDEEYYTYQNTLGPDWGYGVWGKPRTAGVRLAMKL